MPIDFYALCPCGSGKKIKFCCKDLAGEIEKIERMLNADQRQACLEHVELLDKKFPGRAYLETTKAELLRELGRTDEADIALKEVLQRDATNPIALAESALLYLQQDDYDVIDAVGRVQQAIEATGGELPDKLLEAVAALANHLYAQGYLPACLAHMHLYLAAEPDDEGAQRALSQFYESQYVSLLLKDEQPWRSCPDDAPWKEAFAAAEALAESAAWQAAEDAMQALPPDAQKSPAVLSNLAMLHARLADHQGAVDSLRALAVADIPLDEAVEAEALAQLLDVAEPDETIDVLRVETPIADIDRLGERLSADQRIVATGRAPEEQHYDGGPPPRAAFVLLDRAMPETGVGIAAEDVPLVRAQVYLFGRQTDREARLEMLTRRDEHLMASKTAVAEIGGDALGTAGEEEVVDQEQASAHRLRNDMWMPLDTPHDHAQDLTFGHRRDTMLQRWPDVPFQRLDGKTPRQAAGEPNHHVTLLALILTTELAVQRRQAVSFDFNELRKVLDLPLAEPIDPEGKNLSELPLVRMSRLRMSELSDDQLLSVFLTASNCRATVASFLAAQEITQRPDLQNRAAKHDVYTLLGHLSEDTRDALKFLDQARAAAEEAGESSAQWDIQELMLRMRRVDNDDIKRLFEHISTEHINEPGVRQTMARLLVNAGVLNPDGSPAQSAEPAGIVTPGGAGEEGKIWTPESETPEPSGQKGAIWTPD